MLKAKLLRVGLVLSATIVVILLTLPYVNVSSGGAVFGRSDARGSVTLLDRLLAYLPFVYGPQTRPPAPSATPPITAPPSGTIYYVSKSGSNGDGRSWASAWNELDQIRWASIGPGATILLDGGAATMRYASTLTIGKSGAPDKPITLRLADQPGRNGRAVIDGGLSYWPCQATTASPYSEEHPAGTRRFGIDLNGQSWIVIDGGKKQGIEIKNHNESGVKFSGASHSTLAHLHIHHNTYAKTENGQGVDISGDDNTLSYIEINNNGQDAIQGGDVSGLRVEYSYLHDHYCSHPDGIQLFHGQNTNITIINNLFENGFLQAIFLGEANPAYNSSTSDVLIAYNVLRNMQYGIKSHNDNNKNWRIYNNTIVDIAEQGVHLWRGASGIQVRNNILYNAGYAQQHGVQSNNLFYGVANPPTDNGAITADPRFANAAAGNYQLQAQSPAIDRGAAVGLTHDMLGAPVPSGAAPDIGAFEFRAAP
jgi:hypothetical protein